MDELWFIINHNTGYMVGSRSNEADAREYAEEFAKKNQGVRHYIAKRVASVTDVVVNSSELDWEE